MAVYFFSYYAEGGFGNATVSGLNSPLAPDDFRVIEEHIQKQIGTPMRPAIISFQKLEDPT